MAGQSKDCPQCGKQIAADVKFCGSCGANTQALVQSTQPSGMIASNVDQVVTAAKGMLSMFSNEEQDPTVVREVHAKVSQILTSSEEIHYIAVQKKLVMNLAPNCAVLTNRRFIVYKPTLLGGVEFEDHLWRDLYDAHVSEGIRSATLSFKTVHGRVVSIDDLPKAQARRLYTLAQSMEEQMQIARWHIGQEERRAAAGGVTISGVPFASQPVPQQASSPQPAPQVTPADDPMQTLTKLKGMLDAGLITADEYNAKKAEILAKM